MVIHNIVSIVPFNHQPTWVLDTAHLYTFIYYFMKISGLNAGVAQRPAMFDCSDYFFEGNDAGNQQATREALGHAFLVKTEPWVAAFRRGSQIRLTSLVEPSKKENIVTYPPAKHGNRTSIYIYTWRYFNGQSTMNQLPRLITGG